MNIEEFWEGFYHLEKDLFQKSCCRLLKQTFIVRDRDEESKRAYYFISKNPEPFSVYLGYIGFDVLADRENGVVMLRNCRDMGENGRLQINHVALKKMESVVLCCLWAMWRRPDPQEACRKTSQSRMADLRFELEKHKVKDQIDKSTMTAILSLFSRYQLLQVVGRIGDDDCRICLRPSMQFALDPDEFQNFVNTAEKRMQERWNETDSEMDEEEQDADTDE